MSTSTTGMLPSCELHKRHLIEAMIAAGSTAGRGLLEAHLDMLVGEGCLLTDYEAQAILDAGGSLPDEILPARSSFPPPPRLS